jgi:hypothetical protein
MMEDAEEDFDFDYEDDDQSGEEADVGLENKYYSAKGTIHMERLTPSKLKRKMILQVQSKSFNQLFNLKVKRVTGDSKLQNKWSKSRFTRKSTMNVSNTTENYSLT